MAAALYRVHGSKQAQSRWFNPAAQALHTLKAKEQIPAKAAATFLSLMERRILPSWVTQAVDIDLIKAAAP
jgi:hypothetical protein